MKRRPLSESLRADTGRGLGLSGGSRAVLRRQGRGEPQLWGDPWTWEERSALDVSQVLGGQAGHGRPHQAGELLGGPPQGENHHPTARTERLRFAEPVLCPPGPAWLGEQIPPSRPCRPRLQSEQSGLSRRERSCSGWQGLWGKGSGPLGTTGSRATMTQAHVAPSHVGVNTMDDASPHALTSARPVLSQPQDAPAGTRSLLTALSKLVTAAPAHPGRGPRHRTEPPSPWP